LAKKGGQSHLKRLAAPFGWPIHRKEAVWTFKPIPGPHKLGNYLPLAIVLRDILGYAKTTREVKYILSHGMVKVDGRVRRELRFPVGLMDVIEISETNEAFRVLPKVKKGFHLHPISGDEVNIKPLRIDNKTTVKNGHIQLNFHDGSNYLIKVSDPKKPVEDVYRVKDSVVISLEDKTIVNHIPLKENVLALTISGKNIGLWGKIESIEKRFGPYASTVTLRRTDTDKTFQTALEYIFLIGINKPVISLPEE